MVAAPSMMRELELHGFRGLRHWSRGVDATLFSPKHRRPLGLKPPVFVNVGRVAVEKNIPGFLDLDLPGTKLVVGDGPDLSKLKRRYPDTVFVGEKTGIDIPGEASGRIANRHWKLAYWKSMKGYYCRMDKSGKAPDALLRLGQSLAALHKKEAACAALAEVGRKYPHAAASVKHSVAQEQKRVHC